MLRPSLLMTVYVQLFWLVVLISSIFYFEIEGSHSMEGVGYNTHTQTYEY